MKPSHPLLWYDCGVPWPREIFKIASDKKCEGGCKPNSDKK